MNLKFIALIAVGTLISALPFGSGNAADPPNSRATRAIKHLGKLTLEDQIVKQAKAKIGQKIGDGQCTSFVSLVLSEVHAKGSFPTTTISVDNHQVKKLDSYGWGKKLVTLGKNAKPISPKPGQILQFENMTIKDGYSSWSLGTPHHTAIVIAAEGRKVTVLHQNMENGDISKSHVRQDTFDLSKRVSGTYDIYYAVKQ